jgi:hypothetical protein
MNWKEFLKPNKEKLSIVFIIFIVLIASITYSEDAFFLWFQYSLFFALLLQGVPSALSTIIYWGLHLFFFYVISCFIVWIYEKVKKKK